MKTITSTFTSSSPTVDDKCSLDLLEILDSMKDLRNILRKDYTRYHFIYPTLVSLEERIKFLCFEYRHRFSEYSLTYLKEIMDIDNEIRLYECLAC